MKMLKKVASFILAGAMTLAMTASVFAITGVSAEEQKILNMAETKAAELGVPTSNSEYQKYYAQTVDYLQRVDLTTDQVNQAMKAMSDGVAEVQAAISKEGVSLAEFAKLYPDKLQELKKSVASNMQATLNAAGIDVKLVVNADGSIGITPTVPAPDNKNQDQTGNKTNPDNTKQNPIVYSGRSVVVQTGSDLTATVLVAAAVVGAIAVCGVVAKKKDLFSGSEA